MMFSKGQSRKFSNMMRLNKNPSPNNLKNHPKVGFLWIFVLEEIALIQLSLARLYGPRTYIPLSPSAWDATLPLMFPTTAHMPQLDLVVTGRFEVLIGVGGPSRYPPVN